MTLSTFIDDRLAIRLRYAVKTHSELRQELETIDREIHDLILDREPIPAIVIDSRIIANSFLRRIR